MFVRDDELTTGSSLWPWDRCWTSKKGIKQNVVRDEKIVTYSVCIIINEKGTKQDIVRDEEIMTYIDPVSYDLYEQGPKQNVC